MKLTKPNNADIKMGTGNVFADLGFADAGERQLKTRLAMRLNEVLGDLSLTQNQIALRLEIAQPHVSELMNFKLNRFSSERLMHFLTCFEHDVEIVIRPTRKGAGQIALSTSTR